MHHAFVKKREEGVQIGRLLSASGMCLLLLVSQTAPLMGNPSGGTVVAGGATIGAAGATLSINQSTQNAIINWQQFSIASGETTKFIVPNGGATLSRVTGGNPSAIYGSLLSNGALYLVNPNGIVVGSSGRINTASFLASTLDVSNEQFMAGGNLEFSGSSTASVENDGVVHASTGDVYLIANQVTNNGLLSARQGNVGLAAGSDVLFQQAGSQHLFVQATPAGTKRAVGVTNAGTIHAAAAELKAAGGNAYALAINNTGVIAATGYKKINGQVYLTSDGGSISNSGTISARTAKGNGGTIVVDGTSVASAVSGIVTNSGTLSASASAAGGKGGSVTLKNKSGTVIHSGTILAKGGQGGTGGSVDISGKVVKLGGTVDTTSPGGTTGNLLIDPATLDVITGGSMTDITASTVDNTYVSSLLDTNNLTLNADTNITVTNAITWGAPTTLTLSTNDTGSTIDINAPITAINGGLLINTEGTNDVITTTANIQLANFTLENGYWNQNANGAALAGFTVSNDFALVGSSTFLRVANGSGTTGSPYQLVDEYGLQGIASPSGSLLGDSFQMVNSINFSDTSVPAWNGGVGFLPIGGSSTSFTGTFNGNGYTIDGLYLNDPSGTFQGLFGVTGTGATIANLGLTNVQILGGQDVGGLAGDNNGAGIFNDYVTGLVTGSSTVGGLVGNNNAGSISSSYSGASVAANSTLGGLVGFNGGTITNAYSYGPVTATQGTDVGGLIGVNYEGTITDAYSSGTVTVGSGSVDVGAFAGNNGGAIVGGFWDSTLSGQTLGVGTGGTSGVTGDTTTTLMNSSTYSAKSWSIGTNLATDTWVILNGKTRPVLASEYSTTITNAHQLELIELNSTTLAASYSMANNIDMSEVTNPSDIWGTSTTSGVGFIPIGSDPEFGDGAGFSGTFNGNGYTISNLYANAPTTSYIGLFGGVAAAGTVENVTMANVNLTAQDDVGGLAGENDGTITNASSSGTVYGSESMGGLVGYNNGGSISGGSSSVTVTGPSVTYNVGGLVGDAPAGAITDSYSTGSVTGFESVGGLVGDSVGTTTVTDCYSSATVTGTEEVGGLIGISFGGAVSNVYSIGSVTGLTGDNGTVPSMYVGGLIGNNVAPLSNAYSSGLVTPGPGSTTTGGLVGTDDNGAVITDSFFDTVTSGQTQGDGAMAGFAGITGDTTTTLMSASTYSNAGWSIGTSLSDTWVIFNGQTRPLLSMEQSTTITNAHQLQLIGLNAATENETYKLANNIDISATGNNASDIWGTSSSNGGAGFVPVGLTGDFNGQGYTINGLYINAPTTVEVGLFGTFGGSLLENVGLTNVQVTGDDDVGGLIGENYTNGIITNVYTTGTVTGVSTETGGLIGSNDANLSNAYSTATVSSSTIAGGLVGFDDGSIFNTHSSGTVTCANTAGGLVGQSNSPIFDSYSTSDVTGNVSIGGLVGTNAGSGTITNCYSTGRVTGTANSYYVGGLVGFCTAPIVNSYSSDLVVEGSGATGTGGLVGYAYTGSSFTNTFWDTDSAGVALGVGSDPTNTTPGVKGATTAQLESETYILTTYPASPWNFNSVWNTGGGALTPQLDGLPQTLPPPTAPVTDLLSGTAYTDDGVTPSFTVVDLIFDGTLLGSTDTTSSGAFSFSVSSTDLTGGVLLTDADDNGNTYYQANNPATNITGIDIWGNTLRVMADTASNSALATTAGSLTSAGINYSVVNNALATTSGTDLSILSNYTLDGNVTAGGKLSTASTSVVSGSSSVTLAAANMNLGGSITETGTLTFNPTGSILASASVSTGGFILSNGTWNQITGENGLTSLPTFTDSGNFKLGSNTSFERTAGGNGTSANPYQITDVYGLQGLTSDVFAGLDVELINNIDATGTTNWNSGAGFSPIAYSGSFNGQNFTVNDLYINLPSSSGVGLFASVSDLNANVIENLGVTNAQITGGTYVGALAGKSGSPMSNVYSSGTVTGHTDVGGLVGGIDASLTDAHSSASVAAASGSSYVGGLVGNLGDVTISDVYSTGSVTAPAGSVVGGLVGYDDEGTVNVGYSTDAVTAIGGSAVGGLVGDAYIGTIKNVYSTGTVAGGSGSTNVGGLVGSNEYGTISNAYTTSLVSGAGNIGALIGSNYGTVSNSFYDTDISDAQAGVGLNAGTVETTGGATTAQLESQSYILAQATTSPTFDFTNVWTTDGATRTPQLTGLPTTPLPTPPGDTLSGTAFTDSGVTATGSGTTIDLIFDGSLLGSTTTNSSGGFSFTVSSSDLNGGILLTDATDNGNTYYQANAPTANIAGIDIWGSTLRVLGNTASNTALGTAAGNLSGAGVNYTVNAAALATSSGVNMQILAPYTLDGNITASGTLTSSSAGSMTSSVANVTLSASAMNLAGSVTSSGEVTMNATGSIADSGSLSSDGFILENGTWTQIVGQNGLTALPTFTDTGDFELKNSSTFERFAGGTGTTGSPYQITDVYGLQGLASPSNSLFSADAILNNNIDATGTPNWNDGAGFVPISAYVNGEAYTGTFNGQNFTINGLVIDLPTAQDVGLFGSTGDTALVENLGVTNAQVTGYAQVGGLVGYSFGDITNAYSTGTVTAGSTGFSAGGLVGLSQGGTISDSHSTATVSGNDGVGGLVGLNIGTISGCYSTGSITISDGGFNEGGLVGENNTSISDSYSTGNVNAGTNFNGIGGLVGYLLSGTVTTSYSTGSITGGSGGYGAGGLIGDNGGAIENAYSTGNVSASGCSALGGLVGSSAGTIENAYSTGSVSGGNGATNVGGLVGNNETGSVIENSFWDIQTAGVITGIGSDPTNTTAGVTGATTAQLTSQTYILANSPTTPTWDFTNVWTTNGGTLTPQLMGLPTTPLPTGGATFDTLNGTAFTNSGTTFSPDTTIDLVFDGSLIGATTTSGTGTFSFNIAPSDLNGGVLLTDATDNGNTYYQANAPTANITGIDIWGSTLRILGNTASNTALGTAAGSLSGAGINYTVNAAALATNSGVNMQILAPYTLDGDITASGTLTSSSAGSMTSSVANVTLSASAMNLAGSVTSSGEVTMNATGSIADSGSLSTDGFILENGTWTQIVGQNGLTALPTFTDTGDFELKNSSTFERFAGGAGTTGSPYQITDVYGLQGLGSPSGSLLGSSAELMNGIDATGTSRWNAGAGFVPIGLNTVYTGTFNGQGNTINGLFVDLPGSDAVGLFSTATGTLENVNLTAVQVTGSSIVGGLAGAMGNTAAGTAGIGVVVNSSSSGTITGGGSYIGGLIGLDHGTSVTSSYSAGTVSGSGFVGGLEGSTLSTMNDVYSTANVSATSGPVGGLLGENYYEGVLHNAYSTGTVTGTDEVGGLVGRELGTINNSFWDTSTSGITSSTGGVGSGNATGVTPATTAQLESTTFILANAPTTPTWDFTNVWTTTGGTTTPQLIGLPENLPNGGSDLLSGTAFTDSGVTATGSGISIDLIFDGTLLGSTTTNSSGGFSFTINSNDLASGILLTDPTNNGNSFYQANNPLNSITGIDIWGNTLRITADTASNAALKTVAGNLTSAGINYSVSGANLATTNGVSVNILSGYTLDGSITATGAGSLTVGSDAALTGSSNVTLTGGTVTLSGAATLTGTLTVTSTSGQIDLNDFGGLETPSTAAGMTLNSAGAVIVNDSDISLNGGNFSATGTGYTSMTDDNGEANGINLFDSTIEANGGNITLNGTAGYGDLEEGISSGLGVAIGADQSAVLSTTGNGNITITGTSNQTVASTSDIIGFETYLDSDEATNLISVANGTLSINGTVSHGTIASGENGGTASIVGVSIGNGASLQATGTGTISLTGSATGTGAAAVIGVGVSSSSLSVVDGALNLHGTATGSAITVAFGVGLIESSTLQATGAGSISVIGDSTAATAPFNAGVYIDNVSLTAAGNSGIAVTGNGGTVTGTNFITFDGSEYNPFSTGIFLTNGASLFSTGSGAITLTGTGGTNDSTAPLDAYGGDYGIYFSPFASSNTEVISSGGGISITGTGGTGAGTSYNGGINVGDATIQDTGTGAVTLTGIAGQGVDNNIGLAIEGSTTMIQAGDTGESFDNDSNVHVDFTNTPTSGLLTLNGSSATGDSGTDNNGVAIFDEAQVSSGSAGITINGSSPTGTVASNESISIGNDGILTTPTGALTATSTAGNIILDETYDSAASTAISSPVGTMAMITNPTGSVSLSGGNYTVSQSGSLTMGPVTVQDLDLEVSGDVSQTAAWSASQLSVSGAGTVTLANPANVISALGAIDHTGALNIYTDPGLTIAGAITGDAPVTITELGGNLVFGPSGSITDYGEGNNVILAAGDNLANSRYLTNNSAAGALQLSNGSNYYIYTSDPTYDTFGDITVLPANIVYNATYPSDDLPGVSTAFFYAAAGQVGPNFPNNNNSNPVTVITQPPSTTTGGAANGGSNIVPPVLTPQPIQISQPGNPIVTTTSNETSNNGGSNTPPPFNFTGTGISQVLGQEDGGLANSAGNSGQITSGDIAQMNAGQLNNATNPQAADVLDEALGPIVYQNLADALKAVGDWADVPDSPGNNASSGGDETILSAGDVAEMNGSGVKNIPLSAAPEQLQKAMNDNGLKGMGH